MTKIKIDKFTGLSRDLTEQSSSKFAFSQNFKIFNNPFRLIPFTGMVADENTSYKITRFIYGQFKSGDLGDNIIGYGVESGDDIDGVPEFYKKTAGNLLGSSWSTALSTTGTLTQDRGATGEFNNLFHLYKNYIYFAVGGANIGRLGDLVSSGSSATPTQSWNSLAWQSITQAITASDDYMYWGYTTSSSSYVGVWTNSGSPNNTILTLPSEMQPTCIAELGKFLAIACKPRKSIGISKVFLWDKSSPSWNDVIDWGEGSLKCLANINGTLVGVLIKESTTFNIKPTILVKVFDGSRAITIQELIGENSSVQLYHTQWVSDDNLYFGAKITYNSLTRNCIFAVGKDIDGNWRVTGDINIDNDTSITSIEGFAKFGDIWFVAHNGDGSLNRTLADGTYTGTSTLETQSNQNMPTLDRSKLKQLSAVIVNCEPMPTAGVISLDYKVDGGGYTNIFSYTETSNNSIVFEFSHTDQGIEFTSGRDYQFRLNSQGGVVIKSLTYVYEILDTLA